MGKSKLATTEGMKITAIKTDNMKDERVIIDFSDVKRENIIINGTFNGKRNDVDTLTFSILYTHMLWNWLSPLDTFVYFKKANRWEFCGRILNITTVMDTNGLRREVTCESMEALMNDYVNFENSANIGSTPKDTITNFIGMYNKRQPDFKQIKGFSFDEPMYQYTEFVINLETGKNAVECLFTYLDRVQATMNIRRYDPEIDEVQLGDTDLIMNVYSKNNDVFKVNQPIVIGVNMQEIKSEVDYSQMVNRLMVIGKDDQKATLFNEHHQKKYGTLDAVLNENDLEGDAIRQYAYEYLQKYMKPQITITTKPFDLSFLKENTDPYKVGNIVQVINEPIGINEELYIEELSYNIETYYDTTVTVSNKTNNYLREVLHL